MSINLQNKATKNLINYIIYYMEKNERFPDRNSISRIPALGQIEIFDYLWANHKNLWDEDEDGDVMGAISLCNPYIQALGEVYELAKGTNLINEWRDKKILTQMGMYQLELNLEKAASRKTSLETYEEAKEYLQKYQSGEFAELLIAYCNEKVSK
jgi:hypothetical protein